MVWGRLLTGGKAAIRGGALPLPLMQTMRSMSSKQQPATVRIAIENMRRRRITTASAALDERVADKALSERIEAGVREKLGCVSNANLAELPHVKPVNIHTPEDVGTKFVVLGPDFADELDVVQFGIGTEALDAIVDSIFGVHKAVVSSAGEQAATVVSSSTDRPESLYILDTEVKDRGGRSDHQFLHTHGGLRTLFFPVTSGRPSVVIAQDKSQTSASGGAILNQYQVNQDPNNPNSCFPFLLLGHLAPQSIHAFAGVKGWSMHDKDQVELEDTREVLEALVFAPFGRAMSENDIVVYIRNHGISMIKSGKASLTSKEIDLLLKPKWYDSYGISYDDLADRDCAAINVLRQFALKDFSDLRDRDGDLRALLKRVYKLGVKNISPSDPYVITFLTQIVGRDKIDSIRPRAISSPPGQEEGGDDSEASRQMDMFFGSDRRDEAVPGAGIVDFEALRYRGGANSYSGKLGGPRVGLPPSMLEDIRRRAEELIPVFVAQYADIQPKPTSVYSTVEDSGITDGQFAKIYDALQFGNSNTGFTYTTFIPEGTEGLGDNAAKANAFFEYLLDKKFGGRKCAQILPASASEEEGRDTAIEFISRNSEVPTFELFPISSICIYFAGPDGGMVHMGKASTVQDGSIDRAEVVPIAVQPNSVIVMHVPAGAVCGVTGLSGLRIFSETREVVKELNRERSGGCIDLGDVDLNTHIRTKVPLCKVEHLLPLQRPLTTRDLVAMLKAGDRVMQLMERNLLSLVGNYSSNGERAFPIKSGQEL